jgi:ferredoxin
LWNADEKKPLVCVYCGICAGYCPYHVLALEEIQRSDHDFE